METAAEEDLRSASASSATVPETLTCVPSENDSEEKSYAAPPTISTLLSAIYLYSISAMYTAVPVTSVTLRR